MPDLKTLGIAGAFVVGASTGYAAKTTNVVQRNPYMLVERVGLDDGGYALRAVQFKNAGVKPDAGFARVVADGGVVWLVPKGE